MGGAMTDPKDTVANISTLRPEQSIKMRQNLDLSPFCGQVTKALGLSAILTPILASMCLSQIAMAQTTPIAPVSCDPADVISPERMAAHRLFQSITATRVAVCDKRIKDMEALIKAGNKKGAAAIATADPLFYDIMVRDIARQMSTKDESVQSPLNDFVATFVGVVRDSDTTSAKELLTGNFFYKASDAAIAANTIRNAERADIVSTNNHYTDIQSKNLSLYSVLSKQTPQRAIAGGAVANHPDPAGLLTTRGWALAQGDAGTNRRYIAQTFQQFMCVSMQQWADASAPDERIGRDVTRTPGGDFNAFQTTCKACHGQMDGFRGAFALVDFVADGNTGFAQTLSTAPVAKMNQKTTEYPNGYPTTDNSFLNFATGKSNSDQFGWSGTSTNGGFGIKAFGQLIADSKGFSRCMVRRAFTAICRRSPVVGEESQIRSLADQFETDGYHMRRMFENVAIQPNCVK